MPIDVTGLPAMLQMSQVDEHLYEGKPEYEGGEADIERNVVFGGQILAQMIMAAHLDRSQGGPVPQDRGVSADAKEVKSIHAIFARAGDYSQPIRYAVDRMHDGRALGSDTVTFSQGGKIMSRGLILWSKDEPDLIRHTARVEMPDVPGPEHPVYHPDNRVIPGATARVVDGVNTYEAEPLRPPLQNIWTRYDRDYFPVANQAILAWGTDGYLIGTAMLPHEGYSESHAHRTISTGVLAHTVNFHERFRADEWLLLANESIWAGRGRTHGRCNVWTEDGRLVATYTQDNMVRGFSDGQDHSSERKRIM
jgi:acyl-CoA thioesterase II